MEKPKAEGGVTPGPDANPTPVSTHAPSGDFHQDRITFACPGCGTRLSIGSAQAGTSGPCPACGCHVVSPGAPVPSARTAGKPAATRKRTRIQPDAVVDHVHLEHRESMRSLKVIALFILTVCICVAVAWFLRDHLAR